MYLNMDPVPLSKDDPYEINRWDIVAQFYREHERKFPLVAELARRYLSAPVSSVYSERLFSEMGQVYERKRSRLTPKNAEGLLMLHHNMLKMEAYNKEEKEARDQLCKNLKNNFRKYDDCVGPRDWIKTEADSDIRFAPEDLSGIYSEKFRNECPYLNLNQ